jgi:Skp family chaperone for outer membrane proteins
LPQLKQNLLAFASNQNPKHALSCSRFFPKQLLKTTIAQGAHHQTLKTHTMRLNRTLFFLALLLSTSLSAQKIGYANMSLILSYMPEANSADRELGKIEQKLSAKIQAKQQFYQTKLEEYNAFASDPKYQSNLKPLQDEIINLEAEINKDVSDAQNQLAADRERLMAPILKKLETEIKALSAAEGYDYILNSKDSGGVSIVLYGPPEHELTRKILKRLGIEIPGFE